MLIGIPVNELHETKDLEVITFRRNILRVCKESIHIRELNGAKSRALYAFPPDISSDALPPHLGEKMKRYGDGLFNLINACCFMPYFVFKATDHIKKVHRFITVIV